MRLLVNGLSLPVTQLGPDFLLLESPASHPPAEASLVMQVDQTESRWRVMLPAGISSESNWVAITSPAGQVSDE